jgi:hypothetical protein
MSNLNKEVSESVINGINEVIRFTCENTSNNRSSKRTDIFHKSMMRTLLKQMGITFIDESSGDTWYLTSLSDDNTLSSVKFEYRVNCYYGNLFNCDAVIFNKCGEIVSVILFKFPQTSILKNLFNNLNTKAGEVLRLTGGSDYIKKPFNIIFFEVLPKRTYCINNSFI